MKQKYMIISIFLISLAYTGCKDNEETGIEINSKTSGCQGFRSLGKRATFKYSQDSADYCSAEKLRWEYDIEAQTLILLHLRNLQNCGASIRMQAQMDGAKVILNEVLEVKEPQNCLCYFDTYCEVPNIKEANLVLVFEEKEYDIVVNDSKGDFVLDTSKGWPCP